MESKTLKRCKIKTYATRKRIKRIYNNMNGWNVNKIGYDPQYSLTYGEVTQEGIESLVEIFNKQCNILKYTNERRTFYDIGSGIGRIVITVASLLPKIKSKGIELVKDRHDMAMTAYNQLPYMLKNRIQFIEGSVFNYNISDAGWIFISNLCFSDDINKKIAIKLEKETKINTLIICSKKLELHSFESLPNVIISMTWNTNSDLFFYKKLT